MTTQDDPNEAKSADEQTQEVQVQPERTGPTARLQEMPLGWTQMTEPNPADRLRYPNDAAELNMTDTDVMIVGTAGQKITQIGPDFSSQVNPNITELVLRSHLIKKMEGLEGFTKLELLELYDNQVEELKCLGDGENGAPGPTLRVLDMSYNVIRDMAPVALCQNLQELYLANNKLKSLQGLGGLTKLRKIDLGANRIRIMDEAELSGLVNLEELWLGKNKIEVIGGLEKLHKLRRLDLQSNRLESVENLTSQMDTLEELYLSHNGITTEGAAHATGLAQQFTALSVLDLSRNRLDSPAGFAHIATLDELWLSGNQIASFDQVQALSALPSLDTIYLEYNPLQQDPLYRKKLAAIIPCLKQIDANMIGSNSALYGVTASATSSALRTPPIESEEDRVRRLQDETVARAQAETNEHQAK